MPAGRRVQTLPRFAANISSRWTAAISAPVAECSACCTLWARLRAVQELPDSLDNLPIATREILSIASQEFVARNANVNFTSGRAPYALGEVVRENLTAAYASGRVARLAPVPGH